MASVAKDLGADDLLFFIGADVIDGTCGLEPAIERLNLAADALLHGISVCVTCSFRSCVAPEILERIRLMLGVHFLLRDNDSLANFRRQTQLDAEYFPDLALFSKGGATKVSEEIVARVACERRASRTVIAVNFAEHSFRSFYDDHSSPCRKEFIEAVLRSLLGEFPDAFYVLLSNDERTWHNHPSDDEYAQLAFNWLCGGIGSNNVVKVEGASYGDNIAILRSIDLLVTGRMHLALAAFRAETIPLVLMGKGKGYTSIDKMRGAFRKHLDTAEGIVSEVEKLGEVIVSVSSHRERLVGRLRNVNLSLSASRKEASRGIFQRIDEKSSEIPGGDSSLRSMAITAVRILGRQADQLAIERERSNGLQQELRGCADALATERVSSHALRQALEAEHAELDALRQALDTERRSTEALQQSFEEERAKRREQEHALHEELAASEALRQAIATERSTAELQEQALLAELATSEALREALQAERVRAAFQEQSAVDEREAGDALRQEVARAFTKVREREQELRSAEAILRELQERAVQLELSATWRMAKLIRSMATWLPQPIRKWARSQFKTRHQQP